MVLTQEQLKTIRKFALKNAIDYSKANEKAVLGKSIGAMPELKQDMKTLVESIRNIVKEVNSLQKEQLQQEFSTYAQEFKEIETERAKRSSEHDFSIDGATKGNFVTRFPPEPGGYMHIGHAKPAFIEDTLRNEYEGKLVLDFDDTNPELAKQEFVDAFKEDLKWLGIKFDDEYYSSDMIPSFYEYAETAIAKSKAYVCMCSRDVIKEGRLKGIDCEHKSQSVEQNLKLWQDMLQGNFKDNEAVLRFNSDMKAQNTTMRDPTLFRIKSVEHYKQGRKYTVWPTYDFCTPIVDSTNGITDVIRSKEYELRDELYFTVLDALELRKPRITSIARLEIANNITSKRKIRALINEGKVNGWDDPRIMTIRALRHRGIVPEAIREFALKQGMSKSESVANIETLLGINRKFIDKDAKRMFMVENPVKLTITNLGEKTHVKLKLHPQQELGFREYDVGNVFYISSVDAEKLHVKDRIRLKDLFNVEITSTGNVIEAMRIDDKNTDMEKLQWVGEENKINASIWHIGDLLHGEEPSKDSLKIINGYIETYATSLREGDVVNLERMGFYKFDDKNKMSFLEL